MRVNGSQGAKPLECINPPKNRWAVRWGFQPDENDGLSYEETVFDYKPSTEEIRGLIGGWINQATETEIISGYYWRNIPVWLSSENQLNYKTAHDLAVQTTGATLPVTFKLGTSEDPVYYTFENLEEITEFFTGVAKHIQGTIAEGWREKDNLDLTPYEG